MSHKQRLLKMCSAISVMVLATLMIVACGSNGIAGQLNNGKSPSVMPLAAQKILMS